MQYAEEELFYLFHLCRSLYLLSDPVQLSQYNRSILAADGLHRGTDPFLLGDCFGGL